MLPVTGQLASLRPHRDAWRHIWVCLHIALVLGHVVSWHTRRYAGFCAVIGYSETVLFFLFRRIISALFALFHIFVWRANIFVQSIEPVLLFRLSQPWIESGLVDTRAANLLRSSNFYSDFRPGYRRLRFPLFYSDFRDLKKTSCLQRVFIVSGAFSLQNVPSLSQSARLWPPRRKRGTVIGSQDTLAR